MHSQTQQLLQLYLQIFFSTHHQPEKSPHPFPILYTYIEARIWLWIAERVYASASFWNTCLRICKRLLPYAWRRLWFFHLSPEANATRKCKRIFVLSAVYYIDVKMFGRRWCCNFYTKEVISRLWEKNTFRKVSFQSWEILRWQSRKMDIQSTTLILHLHPEIYKFIDFFYHLK